MSIFSELVKRLRKSRQGKTAGPRGQLTKPDSVATLKMVPKLTGFKVGTAGSNARERRQEYSRQLRTTKKNSQTRRRAASITARISSLGNLRPNFRGLRLSFRSRALRLALGLLVVACAGYGLARITQQQDFWLVEEVNIIGEASASARRDFEQQANAVTGQNIFAVDTRDLTAKLEESPFIRSAYVRKKFPNSLEVELVESVPAVKLVSLTGVRVYDQVGEEIFEKQGEQVASLSETERIMYTEVKPFKNDIVKQLWQQAEEGSLREMFRRENAETEAGEGGQAATGAASSVGTATASGAATTAATAPTALETNPTEEEKWQEFLKQKFTELPISAIAGKYNEARRTILFSVSEIWQANAGLVDLEGAGISEVYSLVDVGQSTNGDLLALVSSREKITDIFTELKDYNPAGIELISEFTYRVRLAESSQFLDNSYVYFSLRKDTAAQNAALKLLIEELVSNGRRVQKIDLTGEKVVVSEIDLNDVTGVLDKLLA